MNDEFERQHNLERILHSPSYRVASQDVDFLDDPQMRATRIHLELLKPELAFQKQNVVSTIVVFGGTRITEPRIAQQRLEAARARSAEMPGDPARLRAVKKAERLAAKSGYYDVARQFAALISAKCQENGERRYVVVTGGGPGIMEAANRGAYDVQAKSVGLNIRLPWNNSPIRSSRPNSASSSATSRCGSSTSSCGAKALVAFPGGYGTLDELFETLTLRQTRRMQEIPVILFGREFWEKAVNFQFLADEGVIDDADLDLFQYAQTPEQAWEMISEFHRE